MRNSKSKTLLDTQLHPAKVTFWFFRVKLVLFDYYGNCSSYRELVEENLNVVRHFWKLTAKRYGALNEGNYEFDVLLTVYYYVSQ
jgi:hypothetical protein